MIYRTLAFFCLAAFVAIYLLKISLLIKRGIIKRPLYITEFVASKRAANVIFKSSTFIAWLIIAISVIDGKSYLPIMYKVLGVYLGLTADSIILFEFVHRLKKREKTKGIYSYSRNPLYLAFDLLYIGIALMYCNPLSIAAAAFMIVFFHVCILKEEKILRKESFEEFKAYREKTSRYYGFGKPSFKKILCAFYLILTIWCILYFATIVFYASIFLSWVWIWILIGLCSFTRFVMLKRDTDGISKKKIPIPIRMIYYSLYALGLISFIIIEINIFSAMTAKPKENLEYVIVLGAGLNGTTPSNTLRKRIEEGYEYMSDNPDTLLIASGGQGFGESISEAECIKRELVKKGIDENRIILEDKSTSTVENLKFSLEIIEDPNASVGIVTNSFHEYRAGVIAKKVGYRNSHPVPAITLLPVGIHYMLREYFGVVKMFLDFL